MDIREAAIDVNVNEEIKRNEILPDLQASNTSSSDDSVPLLWHVCTKVADSSLRAHRTCRVSGSCFDPWLVQFRLTDLLTTVKHWSEPVIRQL